MTSRQHTALDELLHSGEGFAEVLGLLDARRLVTELTEGLREGRATESQRREAEVDMVDRVCGVRNEHRGEDLLHVRDLTDSADDDGAWAQDLLPVRVLLRHRERVLTRGDIDAERDREVRSSLYGVVETSIFALIAAGPHPVGAEGNTLEAVGKGRKDNVRQCLSDGELATSDRIYQCCHGSVTDRGSDTCTATEVDCHSTAVAQGELDLTLTLLASYTARDGAVDLVRQPVLTSNTLLL